MYSEFEMWKMFYDYGLYIIVPIIEEFEMKGNQGLYIERIAGSTKIPKRILKIFPEHYIQQKEKIYNFLDTEGYIMTEARHPVLKKYKMSTTTIIVEGNQTEENVFFFF